MQQQDNHERSEERFSRNAETELVCRLLLEKKKRDARPTAGHEGQPPPRKDQPGPRPSSRAHRRPRRQPDHRPTTTTPTPTRYPPRQQTRWHNQRTTKLRSREVCGRTPRTTGVSFYLPADTPRVTPPNTTAIDDQGRRDRKRS